MENEENKMCPVKLNVVYFNQDAVSYTKDPFSPLEAVSDEYAIEISFEMSDEIYEEISDDWGHTTGRQTRDDIENILDSVEKDIVENSIDIKLGFEMGPDYVYDDNLFVFPDNSKKSYGVYFLDESDNRIFWVGGGKRTDEDEVFVSFLTKMDIRRTLLVLLPALLKSNNAENICIAIKTKKYGKIEYKNVKSMKPEHAQYVIVVESTLVNGVEISKEAKYMIPFQDMTLNIRYFKDTNPFLYPLDEKGSESEIKIHQNYIIGIDDKYVLLFAGDIKTNSYSRKGLFYSYGFDQSDVGSQFVPKLCIEERIVDGVCKKSFLITDIRYSLKNNTLEQITIPLLDKNAADSFSFEFKGEKYSIEKSYYEQLKNKLKSEISLIVSDYNKKSLDEIDMDIFRILFRPNLDTDY